MGKQTDIKLRGTVGNLVYYQWKGIDCVRTKPDNVKQSKGTIENAVIFGLAANRSAVLRSLLKPILPEPGNRQIMIRLHKAFSQWLKTNPLLSILPIDNISFFSSVSLNVKNELSKFFRIAITVSRKLNGELIMHIPAFDPVAQITAPAQTKQLSLQVMIASIQLNEPMLAESKQNEFMISYVPGILPAQDISLPVATSAGRLIIIAVALLFFTGNNKTELINSSMWKPAAIVGSFYN